jgi:UDP-N-acetylmuramoyl-L-alanyl-D-glutamate--2,6-diaminopimelate ligase
MRPTSVDPIPLSRIAALVGASAVGDVQLTAGDVTGLSLRSASVQAGDLYVALPGARTHGARFAADAVAAGAVAILTDAEGVELCADVEAPVLETESPRSVLGELAALVYGRPADALLLVGVTGTQGKTTTTQLISRAAAATGATTAVVGTMGTWIDGEPVGSALTTPEAPDLHALFAVMRERGVGICAMEVSSHALVMGRVDGVVFDLAVFTNLGRDHLDFHADMEDYFAAKAELFTPERRWPLR